MEKTQNTANDWLTQLMESTGCYGHVDEVPEGWMTFKEMTNQFGMADSTMNARIQKWLKQGLVQKKAYKINNGKQIAQVFHYYKN